ncbi:MAG: hypothetical protein V4726_17025 [Verrucomicrobiota bacterium]
MILRCPPRPLAALFGWCCAALPLFAAPLIIESAVPLRLSTLCRREAPGISWILQISTNGNDWSDLSGAPVLQDPDARTTRRIRQPPAGFDRLFHRLKVRAN